MPLRPVIIPWLLAISLCLAPRLAFGAEVGVLLLPGAGEALLPRARIALGVSETGPLNTLRLRPGAVTSTLPLYALPLTLEERCPDSVPRLGLTLDAIFEALDFLDLEGAREGIRDVDLAFRCGGAVPSTLELGRYLFALGTLEVYAGGDGSPYFADALGITPDLPRVEDYPEAVVAAFDVGRASLGSRERVKVTMPESSIGGAQLYLDGRGVEPGTLYLPTGRHALGWVLADGRHVGSTLAEVVPSPGGVTWPPESIRPMTLPILGETLGLALEQGRLSKGMETALKGWMEERGLNELLLVREDGRALFVADGAAPHAMTLPPLPRAKVRKAPLAAGIAGALALGCGGYYAYAWNRLATETFPSEDALTTFRSRGLAIGGVGAGMALTSGVMVGVTVLSRGDGVGDLGIMDGEPLAQGLGVELGGRW